MQVFSICPSQLEPKFMDKLLKLKKIDFEASLFHIKNKTFVKKKLIFKNKSKAFIFIF